MAMQDVGWKTRCIMVYVKMVNRFSVRSKYLSTLDVLLLLLLLLFLLFF